jgi:orotidine-5'-phosphate decarboxylase
MTTDTEFALPTNPLICAIDTREHGRAYFLIKQVMPHVGLVKLGLEFFCSHGAHVVSEMVNRGVPVFLDLKFHDIPNTVAGAVRSVTATGCRMLTIHASGGPEMCKAAVDAAHEMANKMRAPVPLVLAVTILTSMDESTCESVGYKLKLRDQVLRLAELALKAGAPGLVCSPQEIGLLREHFGSEPILVTPGIRPVGSGESDQKRTLTPQEALAAGANYIVVGRPITDAEDPALAAKTLLHA